MALFSNTLWGVEGSASQGSEPGTLSSSIPVVTAALQPLNHKEEVGTRPSAWCSLLPCPAGTGVPIQDTSFVEAAWIAPMASQRVVAESTYRVRRDWI